MITEVCFIVLFSFAVCTTVYLYQITKRIRQINSELLMDRDMSSNDFDALFTKQFELQQSIDNHTRLIDDACVEIAKLNKRKR